MNKNQIKRDRLENWPAGKATGYYEPRANEIHLLRGEDVELRTLWHEVAHAARQNTLSFQLARALNRPVVNNLMFAGLILTALTAFIISFVPFFIMAGLFGILVFCQAREELIAERVVRKEIKNLKRGEIP
jgi:hypothetical protein